MSLADALIGGENVYGNWQKNKMLSSDADYQPQFNAAKLYAMNTNNQYLAPNLQADLYAKQTENQYLPQKLKAANDYQNLVNQYYGRSAEADIANKNESTRLMPLNSAIAAQNSMRNGSRYSDASQLIRYINGMKVGDQALYLSDPANVSARDSALKILQQGISNPNQNTIITPQLLNKVGLGGGNLSQIPAPINVPGAAPTVPAGLAMPAQNTPQASFGQTPSAMNNSPNQQSGIAAPMPTQNNMSNPATNPGGGQPPMASLPSQQQTNANAHPMAVDAAAKKIGSDAPNPDLTPNDRYMLGHQAIANSRAAGVQTTNRAQGAIILEKFLQDNQSDFAPRLENAAKYAGAMGQGKLAIDKLTHDNPKAVDDYTFVTKELVPFISNNIKVMEKLASSNQQMQQLNSQANGVINSWYLKPDDAGKLLNQMFSMIHGQAAATLSAAQPITPGVMEKLNGLQPVSGDYVDMKKDSTLPDKSSSAPAKIWTYNKATGKLE